MRVALGKKGVGFHITRVIQGTQSRYAIIITKEAKEKGGWVMKDTVALLDIAFNVRGGGKNG